mgnify:CR=1 FL=1
MVRYTLQIADDIQEYHTGGSFALACRQTLDVLLAKLLLLAVNIVLILADFPYCLHIAILSCINRILEGF